MKKVLLALAVVAATFSLNAQTPTPATPASTTPGACTEQPACAANPRAECANPFAGLDLTAEQQTALDALRANCRADRDSCRQQRTEAKRERLAQIKAILTPEQYVKFLENAFVNANHRPQARPGRDRHRHGNGACPERRANRAARHNQAVATPAVAPAAAPAQ